MWSANFTPVSALVGGVLIGGAATVLMLFLGRIAGVSGIVGSLLERTPGVAGWRAFFIGGLAAGAFGHALVQPEAADITIDATWPAVAVGGLLVGFGTRLGSGCTSGHGVCGLARLSARSLVATATFIASAMLTVFAVGWVLGG